MLGLSRIEVQVITETEVYCPKIEDQAPSSKQDRMYLSWLGGVPERRISGIEWQRQNENCYNGELKGNKVMTETVQKSLDHESESYLGGEPVEKKRVT